MGAIQSNLSDPHYGFDLVVAVTQAGINTTMKQMLAEVTEPEVTICYVYDSNNNLVPVDYKTLVSAAKGSDPFEVPAGADPNTDQDLINLNAANFAGGIKARLGLPDVAPADLPPIVTLSNGTAAPVRFNLLCSEFQVTGFEFVRNRTYWINQAQPTGSGTPWYFSANVFLNNKVIDPNSPTPLAVQKRIVALQQSVGHAFTIQKLFLDLDTAALESVPQIEGIPAGWPVWDLINTMFLGAYFTQLRQKGDPALNYSFTLAEPREATLQLGSVARECAMLVQNGQPIPSPTPAQANASALIYIGSTATTPPIPVPFAWNWIDQDDVTKYSGVQAVRRDVFFTFLTNILNEDAAALSFDTEVPFWYDTAHTKFVIDYKIKPAASPARFVPVPAIAAPGADGFTTLLTISHQHSAHGDASEPTHLFAELWGDLNYSLNGTVAVCGNQIRIQTRARLWASFAHRESAKPYIDLPGANYYDKTTTLLFTLQTSDHGVLQVGESRSVVDQSAPWNFTTQGIIGLLHLEGVIQHAVTTMINTVAARIDSAFMGYSQTLTEEINGYQGWVFPGSDAFTFKNLFFSSGQDLITQLTYVNPN